MVKKSEEQGKCFQLPRVTDRMSIDQQKCVLVSTTSEQRVSPVTSVNINRPKRTMWDCSHNSLNISLIIGKNRERICQRCIGLARCWEQVFGGPWTESELLQVVEISIVPAMSIKLEGGLASVAKHRLEDLVTGIHQPAVEKEDARLTERHGLLLQ
ncbi:unnamed protein product [Pleuronectes platessa]|uniref:Uncharacterized protein n=1 Tax=Pleuronectes platessa TaxID=8262 RepID=A0A9N7UMB3_PLEPL|nr:unnamed protein product [Pleuronectes platessa]